MLGAAAFGLVVAAAVAQPVERGVRVWVDVRDDRGRAVGALGAADLTVFEDGQVVDVTDLLDAGAVRPEVVIYLDAVLATTGAYQRGADTLASQAAALTVLGPVELVIADPDPQVVLSTDDPLALAERLGWLGASERGRGDALRVRTEALRGLRPRPGVPAPTSDAVVEVVRRAIDEERALLTAQLARLLAWADRKPADGQPRVLIPVLEGFDLDLFSAWVGLLDAEDATSLRAARPEDGTLAVQVEETARALAARGWTVMPLAAGSRPTERREEAIEAFRPDATDTGAFPGVVRKPQITFGGGRDGEDDEEAESAPPATFAAPAAPLDMLAEASGGIVLRSGSGLEAVTAELAERRLLVYRSRLAPDADLRPLTVGTSREGWVTTARRWVSRATPGPILEARLRDLLTGEEIDGGFDVAAALAVSETPEDGGSLRAALDARLSVRELAEGDGIPERGALRVTVGWRGEDGALVTHQKVVTDQDLGASPEWRYAEDLEVPQDAGEIAVLIEHLDDGRWGGNLAAVVRGDVSSIEVEATPRATVIEVLRPEEDLLRGRVRFETRTYDRRVAEVAFLLDDAEVARAKERPFEARVDLGRQLRRRQLTVVAYGPSGGELGRNTVVLNAGSGGLGVTITSPRLRKITGPVDVEAEVTVPLERRLERVLFFWNNEQVSTLFAPPFRQRLVVPEDKPLGYVRVVAMLDDGTLAEDVVLLNGPDGSERVDVNLVELYVVVVDPQGRPVRGLTQADFSVREDGKAQEISTFSDAGDLPLTVGLAIDSSASMFVKLPRVQSAAVEFLENALGEQDRAFVVDFDTAPRLARATTGELPRVVRAIQNLEASGRTALWESIVFSLVQLQGVRGRKALIVYSDGADEDDEFPYRSCLKFAKQMGVPVYLILMKRAPEKENTGLSLWTRSFDAKANKLTDSVGGRVFYAREYPSLDVVYAEIEQELRSQYLLGYYPTNTASTLWRDVDVDVEGKGLTPRSLSGYWP